MPHPVFLTDDAARDLEELHDFISRYDMRIPVIPDTHSGGKSDTHSSRSRTPVPVLPDTP